MKRCSACRCDKPESEFGRDRSRRDGLIVYCKICSTAKSKKWQSENPEAVKKARHKWYSKNSETIKKAARKWHQENPEVSRRSRYKCKYGISTEQYDQILLEQGGVCAICKQLDPRRRLAVDHNHATGKIRGLLCVHCNHGLGKFQDRKDLLAEAIGYLDRSEEL